MDTIKLTLGQAVAANRVVNAHASYGKAIREAENLGVSVDLAPTGEIKDLHSQVLRAEVERNDARDTLESVREKLEAQSRELYTLRDAYNKLRETNMGTDFLRITKFLEMLDDARNGKPPEEIKNLLLLAADTRTRIPAIKEVRIQTGLGLKAAKALADLLRDRKPI